MEVECLGACVNAPMLQIGKDFYEDLDGPITEKLIAIFAPASAQAGPQNGRIPPNPKAARTLTDPSLYDGSIIGKYKAQGAAAARLKPKKPGAA